MGKFAEGWQKAHAAEEAREAEKRRRAEVATEALRLLSEALEVDKDDMARHHLSLRMEHGALVLKRVAEPLAGVAFDPDANVFKMHKYSVRQGESESDEAKTIDECAIKLGAYAYSIRS